MIVKQEALLPPELLPLSTMSVSQQIISVTLRLDKTSCLVHIVVIEVTYQPPTLRDVFFYYLVYSFASVTGIGFIYCYLHCLELYQLHCLCT